MTDFNASEALELSNNRTMNIRASNGALQRALDEIREAANVGHTNVEVEGKSWGDRIIPVVKEELESRGFTVKQKQVRVENLSPVSTMLGAGRVSAFRLETVPNVTVISWDK